MPRLLLFFFFFFNDTATTEIYTLSLHDALPILFDQLDPQIDELDKVVIQEAEKRPAAVHLMRSEEHTSELQSQSNLVCRLLLEKKKEMRQTADIVSVDEHKLSRLCLLVHSSCLS